MKKPKMCRNCRGDKQSGGCNAMCECKCHQARIAYDSRQKREKAVIELLQQMRNALALSVISCPRAHVEVYADAAKSMDFLIGDVQSIFDGKPPRRL